jgi:hypothetical protein
MLARNGALKGQPLEEATKYTIDDRFADGAEFIVGDMPGVDSQFIDYLQEIGAKFTIYHTGPKGSERIKLTQNIISTETKTSAFNSPAPQTYVYLSKRLYEIFGYVNPYLVNIGGAITQAKELREGILAKEKVTNTEVQEVIKNCLINTLG